MSKVSRAVRRERQLRAAVERVSVVLRKYMPVVSDHLGTDCFDHACLGRALLRDLGFESQLVMGYAAWTVGHGSGDVLCHVPGVEGLDVEGESGRRPIYHAWVQSTGFIVDFTTYQFTLQAGLLDAYLGGDTRVVWCPDYLLLRRQEIKALDELRRSKGAGRAYYEARPEQLAQVQGLVEPSSELLAPARVLLANPQINVRSTSELFGEGWPCSSNKRAEETTVARILCIQA